MRMSALAAELQRPAYQAQGDLMPAYSSRDLMRAYSSRDPASHPGDLMPAYSSRDPASHPGILRLRAPNPPVFRQTARDVADAIRMHALENKSYTSNSRRDTSTSGHNKNNNNNNAIISNDYKINDFNYKYVIETTSSFHYEQPNRGFNQTQTEGGTFDRSSVVKISYNNNSNTLAFSRYKNDFLNHKRTQESRSRLDDRKSNYRIRRASGEENSHSSASPPLTAKDWSEETSVTPEFVDTMNFTEEEISSCLQGHGRLVAYTNSLRFLTSQGPEDSYTELNTSSGKRCQVTVCTKPGTKIRVIMRSVTGGECSEKNFVRIAEGEWTGSKWCHRCDGQREYRSDSNNVTIKLHVEDASARHLTLIDAYAVELKLELVQLSKTQGYIQTPGNDQWKRYWHRMNADLTIFPLFDHVTLLSMRRVYIQAGTWECADVVYVHAGGVRDDVWELCGEMRPEPKLLDTKQIRVTFVSNERIEALGFSLLFSYLPRHQQPSRVTDGLWNCSVPQWPEFQRHFRCDLIDECQGGEDEDRCHFTPHCGPGRLTLGDKCYSYVMNEERLSWLEASLVCAAQGGHMASLNTAREWEAVLDFLRPIQSLAEVYVGLKAADPALPLMYKHSLQWADGSIAYYVISVGSLTGGNCGYFHDGYFAEALTIADSCTWRVNRDILCEFDSPNDAGHGRGKPADETETGVNFTHPLQTAPLPVPYVACPAGHATHAFLACDVKSACWFSSSHGHDYKDEGRGGPDVPSKAACPAPMTSLPAMFRCDSGSQRVPYNLVCDHRQQCADRSDEGFCVFRACSGSTPLSCATSSECVPQQAYCDHTVHCADLSDESDCDVTEAWQRVLPTLPPAVVKLQNGRLSIDPDLYFTHRHGKGGNPAAPLCPHTHFRCPGNGYCLPVFTRCNGVVDCPGREDEAGCEASVCPGYYRCRSSTVCLHVSSVCDGVHHCPEQDDELYCHFPSCPHNCTCDGLAFVCRGTFVAGIHPELRYLDGAGSGLSLGPVRENSMLVYLSLARCGLRVLENSAFPNLRKCDLSDNLLAIISVEHIRGMPNLRGLKLSGNPLTSLFSFDLNLNVTLERLESIDLSRVALKEMNFSQFVSFPNLLTINASQSAVTRLHRGTGNRSSQNIRVFDLRRCRVTKFQHDVMSGLGELETVFTENYELCCPVFLPPSFNPKNCHAPPNHVSSCDNLLSLSTHRILLTLCCCLALLANFVYIATRVFFVRRRGASTESTDVFMIHLAAGDMMMGVCVATVTVADRLYQGRYVLEGPSWRHSVACDVVGFLFLLSSQVCLIIVFLVTVHVLLFLFSSGCGLLRKPKSVHRVCVLVWLCCAVLAFAPVLSDWEVFGQTAACFPLLATAETFTHPSRAAFTVTMIIFSLSLALLTVTGQACVFTAIQKRGSLTPVSVTQVAWKPSQMGQARRVFGPCVLNVACWVPLCLLAVLAWRGSPLPDELHVHVGMVALPLTSALRPFLHYLAVREESERREREERLMKRISALRQRTVKGGNKVRE